MAKPPKKKKEEQSSFEKKETFIGKRLKIVHFTLSKYVEKQWVKVFEEASLRVANIRSFGSRFIHYFYCSTLQEGRTIPPLENFVRNMFTAFTSKQSKDCTNGIQEKQKLIKLFSLTEDKEKDKSILESFLQM